VLTAVKTKTPSRLW